MATEEGKALMEPYTRWERALAIGAYIGVPLLAIGLYVGMWKSLL